MHEATESPSSVSAPPNTEVIWTKGMWVVVILTLVFTMGYLYSCCYEYRVYRIDFQPTDSTLITHSSTSWDTIRGKERNVYAVNHLGGLMMIYPMLGVLLYTPFKGILLLLSRNFFAAFSMFLCTALPLVLFFFVGPKFSEVRKEFIQNEKLQLTQRGSLIIHALNQYHHEHQRYPSTLDELSPDYLKEIPLAGVLICPEFRYVLPGEEKGERDVLVKTYELNVLLHYAGHHTWPYLLYYRPENEYPEDHSRIEGWAIEYGFWYDPDYTVVE